MANKNREALAALIMRSEYCAGFAEASGLSIAQALTVIVGMQTMAADKSYVDTHLNHRAMGMVDGADFKELA